MGRGRMMGVLGIVLGVGLAAGEASAFSVSYDQTVTHGRDVVTAAVALKDGMFRMDATVGGQVSVIIHNQEGTYTVMPSEGMAMKMPALNMSQRPVQGADDYAQYLQQQRAERIGSETIDGHACDIYRFSDPDTGEATTAWVWKEKMFPIRLETDGRDGKTLVEISNVQLGASISDAAFQLPDGVQVMDMGSLMNMP